MEQHVAAAQLGLGHRGAQRGGGLVVERAEQRRLTQYVVVHESSSVSLARVHAGCRAGSYPVGLVTAHHRPRSGRRTRRAGAADVGAAAVRWARARVAAAETRTGLVRRARKIDRVLAETYPDARCELDFDDPFQLLVVTVLSAQTTDKRVNAVRPTLFAAYPDADGDGRRRPRAPRADHRPARLLPRQDRVAAQAQRRRSSSGYDGEVPPRLDDLVTLPGVGRKTANVVLGNAFGIPGITVDTHFGRLARRFGWTDETDPVKVEHAVGALFPKRDWTMLSHHLIWHGRRVCHAQKPACGACPVAALVPVVRRGPDRPGGGREAGEDRGPA